MSQPASPRSVLIDDAGLEKVRQRMAELQKPQGLNRRGKSCWTREHLAKQAHVHESTVRRFLDGKCDKDYAIAILKTLSFEPLEFLARHDQNSRATRQESQQTIEIDWQRVCSKMLQVQQEDQRFRARATEQGFEVKVFVPLGLVERKQQQRRDGGGSLNVYELEDKEAIGKKFEHDDFLREVMGQPPRGENRHLAIVGEPGAGKTTLLGAIATYVQQNTDALPICVALAGLQGRSLQNYLLEKWLPEAIALAYPDTELEADQVKAFKQRLRQGGVWLLLDGADEMGEATPLQAIQVELTDWLRSVRVVLTCRLNLWDLQVKGLVGFDTYKTQEFSEVSVRRFIKQWFGFARKPQAGKKLRKELEESRYCRIRELVRNPLRLSLLCQISYIGKNAKLPKTKAGLYEQFVRYFYEWKISKLVPDLPRQVGLQNRLHEALGRLALAGLNSPERFRLRQSVVHREMQDGFLEELAKEVIWLNRVDRASGNDEPVYAFFHPTFQEYFAALAIEDWGYFLPHEHIDQPVKELSGGYKSYRIFELQWREVFLLWLGRSD